MNVLRSIAEFTGTGTVSSNVMFLKKVKSKLEVIGILLVRQ